MSYDAHLEKPYEEAAKREDAFQGRISHRIDELWDEFRDELEVAKQVYAYEPAKTIEGMIQAVAMAKAGEITKEKAYERIHDLVGDFIEYIAKEEC